MKLSSSREMLKAEYNERWKRNPRYSLRAYAALLNVPCGRLNEIINGKRRLSSKLAKSFVDKLSFDESEKAFFLQLVESEEYSRDDKRKRSKSPSVGLLSADQFALISDWEYFALMALAETSAFRSEIPWISQKLNITEERTIAVIDHLISHGLLKKNAAGEFKNTYSSLTTLTDVPSTVLRKATIECIQQGIHAMEKVDLLHRDVSSLTIPVDMQQMQEVKALIREFKDKVSELMTNKPTTEIYNLNIQFVPVSQLGV